ncbi:unnamed protein product [Cyprideis torosa]|uniref:Peptidase M14 domain-containing protein n=1 Tax=Cyprideis torosa TaxID=163714 RepID=A0A7R8ZFK7_9CRUS|nr:unnamed protein product [Cyprideis torosa]CAG0879345.1 unnamed protein product [Cyprideis torosa]
MGITSGTGVRLLLLICFVGHVRLQQSAKDYNYTGNKLMEVHLDRDSHVRVIKNLKDSFLEHWPKVFATGGRVHVVAPSEEYVKVQRNFTEGGMKYKVLNPSHGINTNELEMRGLENNLEMTWEFYNPLSEIDRYVKGIAANHEFVELLQIGQTAEERQILGLRINPGNSSHKVWIDGGFHAREWISPATVTYIVDQLTRNYTNNKDIADGFDWWIVPVANPDGYEYTWTHDRLWRKNRRHSNNTQCVGVDLNRNWDFYWMEVGASSDPCSPVYAGPFAESEPEVRAVRDLILELNSDNSLAIMLTIHSFYQAWMAPWGFKYEIPEDLDEMLAVLKAAVSAVKNTHGMEYKHGQVTEFLRPASGCQDDWGKGVAKIKHSYTVELRDRGRNGFTLPRDQILPTAQETWEGVKAAVRKVVESKKRL